MANSNNNANEVKEVNIDEVVLKVKRELIEDAKTKSGEDMYSYVMREYFDVMGQKREFRAEFTVRSKDKKADYGGFDMLDIIFMVSDEAFLRIKDEVMVNTETGETTQFKTYEIYNEDDDGVVYSYKVKPLRDSDASKLDVIIQKKRLAMQKANAKSAADAEQPKKD